MKKDTKFKPGQSGNPETRFKPGNQHRWPPRQSGNPAGITRSRLQFEESFYAAPLDRGRAGVAFLLWNDPHPGHVSNFPGRRGTRSIRAGCFNRQSSGWTTSRPRNSLATQAGHVSIASPATPSGPTTNQLGGSVLSASSAKGKG